MNTIKFENKGNIQMIAHRGVSGLELENTCPAFVAAGVKSYYGIETDVHLTADGKFILHHDNTLKRLAGLDLVIEETSFDELRKIRFKDGETSRMDLFMPTLEEYAEICKKYDKQAILEIKNAMPKEKIWEIVEILKQVGWYNRTTFISFCGENLVSLRERYSDADAQFLTGEATDETLKFMLDNRLDADLCGLCVSKEFVDKLHAAGRKVNCWTIDKIEHAEIMQAMGVDQITSNILE